MASNNFPGIGHNEAPDYAKVEVERLQAEYAAHAELAAELKEKADAITGINSPEEKEVVVTIIRDQRDLKKRLEGLHELEKMPHLQRGRGADNFFFGLIDMLLKRAKPNKDGSGDRLGKMLTDYDSRILAEEMERRRLAAKKAAEEEAKRIAAEAEAARIAEEARLAAERARKPETQEVKAAVAEQAEQAASAARVETVVAASKAEEAHVATLVKPADVMRTRTDTGITSTMGQEKFAEIHDRDAMKADAAKLWAYFPPAAIQTALNGYANAQGYSNDPAVQIAGARFGKRAKSLVR